MSRFQAAWESKASRSIDSPVFSLHDALLPSVRYKRTIRRLALFCLCERVSSHRPQAPAKAQVCGTSYATWETWRRLRARFKHSTSCCASGRTFQEVLQRGRSPSLLPTSCLPLHRLQHGKLAPPQYVGNEVSAISADRGRGDACNEFHVQWRTDSRTSKRE